MSMPFEVFFSYSHEDENWLKKIAKYLHTLQRQNYIQGWHDRNILAGSEWEREVLTRLNTAPIILLLISQDFIASDFCWGIQLQRLYRRALAIQERVLGPEHPDVAETLDNLAFLYVIKRKYDRAEQCYRRALAIQERVLGPEHPDIAHILDSLAFLYVCNEAQI